MSTRDRIVKAVTPLLEPGETVELAGTAYVGNVSTKKRVATYAATAVLTAGMLAIAVQPVKRSFALTDRRLLFLGAASMITSPRSELVGAVPREVVRATRKRTMAVLTPQYDLTDTAGSGEAIRLTFPMSGRKLGRQLAEALNTTPQKA